MNQRVTARIVGGKRFTTAEYREYFNASRILRDQANRLGTSRRSFIAAGYELKIHPRATPLLSALTGASPRCTAQDHIELPYRQLLGRCEAHAEALQSMASQLNELSSLIAQAQSLYAQAEEASRKGLNIMLRGLFMSSRESAILALTASALMGVRRSYAKEGKFNKFYLVESTAWMQESFVSVLGEHASRLNIQERPSKDTSILEYITKTLFMVTKPGAAIAEGLSGKGSVNRGLKKIDRLLIPYFDKDHGDNLSVTRVYPAFSLSRRAPSLVGMLSISSAPWSAAQESQNALICDPKPSRRCFLTTAIPSMMAACSAKASRICAAWTPLVPVRYMSVSATQRAGWMRAAPIRRSCPHTPMYVGLIVPSSCLTTAGTL